MPQTNAPRPKQKKRWVPPAPITDSNGLPLYEFGTFPRQFVSYRWFKPVLVGILGFIFMLVFQIILLIAATIISGDSGYIYTISEGYDDMDVYTPQGALFSLGGVACMLPALLLAGLIVRDRPFSSYTTSRGGWNWSAFWKCVIVAVVVIALPQIVQLILFPGDYQGEEIKFTIIGFIFCMTLAPIQCMAEEYIFRGWMLQSVASWTRIPILGIIFQGIIFASMHPYNELGIIVIFFDGILWGVIAWQTRGLEASGAAHIVNNMFAFSFAGFGLSVMSSEVDIISFVLSLVVDVIYVAVILVGAKKFNWFTAKGDKVKEYNEKRLLKYAAKGKPAPNPIAQMPLPAHAHAAAPQVPQGYPGAPMPQGAPAPQGYPPQPGYPPQYAMQPAPMQYPQQPMPQPVQPMQYAQPAAPMPPAQPIFVNGQWIYPQAPVPPMPQGRPAMQGQPMQQPYHQPPVAPPAQQAVPRGYVAQQPAQQQPHAPQPPANPKDDQD